MYCFMAPPYLLKMFILYCNLNSGKNRPPNARNMKKERKIPVSRGLTGNKITFLTFSPWRGEGE